MSFGLNKIFGIHANAMLLHSKRAEVLANNIANADTPNFKARDIDFKTILAQSEKLKQHGTAFAPEITNPKLSYRVPEQGALDDNTVNKQLETTQYMQNNLRYQANLKFLSGSIKSALSAIKGE